MTIRGFVEAATADGLRGWAFDPARPNAHLMISVMSGGVEIASGLAGQARHDLLAAGIAGGDHGFALSFPARLDENAIGLIQVYARSESEEQTLPALTAKPEETGNEASNRLMPMADLTQHPVFILGPARSGTSALALALIKCGVYEGFGEGHLLPLAGELLAAVRRFYEVKRTPEGEDTLLERVPAVTFDRAIRRSFVQLTRSLFPSGYWVDKTPTVEAVRAAPLMREIWPNAKFVFVKRRVVENIASRIRKFPNEPLEYHYQDWAAVLQAWLAVRGPLGDCALEIEHLEMAREPEKVGGEIARFLKLDSRIAWRFEASLRSDRPQQTGEVIGKIESLDALSLPDSRLQDVHADCDDMMREFGYSYGEEYFEVEKSFRVRPKTHSAIAELPRHQPD